VNDINKWIKDNVLNWEVYALFGIFVIFITIGWYALEYDGDTETIKYSVWTIIIVGMVSTIGSFFSWRKKQKSKDK